MTNIYKTKKKRLAEDCKDALIALRRLMHPGKIWTTEEVEAASGLKQEARKKEPQMDTDKHR